MRRPRWLLLFAFLLVATPLSAQVPTASITGVVTDTAGTPLDGAEVTATHVEAGLDYSTHTVSTGSYWLGGLRPGRYDIAVAVMGYGADTATVRAAVGQTVTQHFRLVVSALELEGISVRPARPLVETTQSDVPFVMYREQIAALPEESRDFIDLALLAPGATTAAPDVDPVAPVQVGALGSTSTAVLVDGANLIGGYSGEYTGSFPLLSIREFEVLTGGYSAEFGQAASGVVNAATRAGTNEIIAEGFVLYRHHALNAKGAFQMEKPEYTRAHFGAAVGGPVRRDRTHYFVAMERRDENAFSTVETGGVFPDYEGTFQTPRETTMLFARIDHRLNPAHELMVRYGGRQFSGLTGVGRSVTCEFTGSRSLAARENGLDVSRDMHSVLGRHRWMVTDRVRNQLTAHFTRSAWPQSRLIDAPERQFPSLCSGGNTFQWDRTTSRVALQEQLSFALAGATGTHHLKLGAEFDLVVTDNFAENQANGVFSFAQDDPNASAFYVQSLSGWQSEPTNGQLGVFVQDDWSPIPDLTLNLGLRYDVETNGTNRGFVSPDTAELPFLPREPRPIDTNNIAPRLGMAWDVGRSGRTVMRAAFGVFYDQMLTILGDLEAKRRDWAFVPTLGATVPPDSVLAAVAVPSLHTLDPEVRTPYTRQYSVGLEQMLPAETVLRLDGVLVQGRNLPFWRPRNPFTGPGGTPKHPGYGFIFEQLYWGESEAKMLIFRLRKAFEWADFDVHYTLADRQVTSNAWSEILPVSDTTTDFSSEFGPADWDEHHRLVFLANAELPYGIDGSVKTVYSSARPYTMIDTVDHNADTFLNDRPPGVGPNTERGPGFFQVDLGLGRSLTIGDSEVGVLFNVYNLLNRTNLAPSTVVESVGSELYGQALFARPKRQAEIGIQVEF